jgi:hypothetical protein
MTAKTEPKETLAPALILQWEQIGNKVVRLAEEFPENKYDFKPSDDVRTFADVLRHVAFWNHHTAQSARGEEADGSLNELPAKKYSSKAQIIAVLRRSLNEATTALKEREEELSRETAEMVLAFIGHSSEHYGQLVVYYRLNGIVPPESRATG